MVPQHVYTVESLRKKADGVIKKSTSQTTLAAFVAGILGGPVSVAPHAPHILPMGVGPFGLGAVEHPVAGRLGNAQDPALRRYRAAAGVGPYHACFRANTGAACSETSTSISSCLSRFRNSISSFSSGVRLSAAFVEPLLRIPCTQRRSVERGMPYSALICDDGLPFPLRLHDLPLELLLVMTGTIRIGHDDQLLRCHVPHEPVRYIVANPVVAHMEDIHTLTRPTFY